MQAMSFRPYLVFLSGGEPGSRQRGSDLERGRRLRGGGFERVGFVIGSLLADVRVQLQHLLHRVVRSQRSYISPHHSTHFDPRSLT